MKTRSDQPGSALMNVIMGVESESLRVDDEGTLSLTDHPFPVESRYFTRDFSESQLEIVTSPHANTDQLICQLEDQVLYAQTVIGSEKLWPFSMPPALPEEADIPIARFDKSNTGRSQYNYRVGLASRYGKKRQMISGVHINVSLGDLALDSLLKKPGAFAREERDSLYLKAARHFYRNMDWLTLLCGATPLAASDYPGDIETNKPVISIRNSRFGYSGRNYDRFLKLSSLDEYIGGIEEGLNRIAPAFLSRGLVEQGHLIQLSDRVFQSEKEFYAPVRLRQIKRGNESESQALDSRGISYLELRFIDKDPFAVGGVNPDFLKLVHLLLLQGTEEDDKYTDIVSSLDKAAAVAEMSLCSLTDETDREAKEILNRTEHRLLSLLPLARAVNRASGSRLYTDVIEHYLFRISNPKNLLSMQVYKLFRESGVSWTSFGAQFMNANTKGGEYGLQYARA